VCYSAQVWADYRKYVREFGATIDIKEFVDLFMRRLQDGKQKIPKAMEAAFKDAKSMEERGAHVLVAQFNEAEQARLENERSAQQLRKTEAERILGSKPTKKAQTDLRVSTDKIEKAEARLLDLHRSELKARDSRIYPGSYAPVMISENGKRVVKPMRYRCRLPGWTSVVERKYDGTYNARRNRLADSWGKLFGYKHGIAVFDAFYEHVARDGNDVILEFQPQSREPMYVACLWSDWHGDDDYLLSFAAITDDPPAEVSAAGHDRCPVPIKPEHFDAWLNPDPANLAALFAILDDRQRPYYEHREAA
jgi:putative SOS response-associated peptidase YedK